MIGELELREDYLSMSPFVRLSRQQMQAPQPGARHLRFACSSGGIATASLRPYELQYDRSVFRRMQSEAAAAATRSAAFATDNGGSPLAGSTSRVPGRYIPAQPDKHVSTASPEGTSNQAAPLFPREGSGYGGPDGLESQQEQLTRHHLPAMGDVSSETWLDYWVDATIGEVFEEDVDQPAVVARHYGEFGSAAELAAADISAQLSQVSTYDMTPFLMPPTARQLPHGKAGGLVAPPSRCGTGSQQQKSATCIASLADPQQRYSQHTWTQRFCDGHLEQRFRLYQARMLHSDDYKGALVSLALFFVNGFAPTTELWMAPLTWLLLLVAPAMLAFIARTASRQWYRHHRETILMCAVFAMLVISGHFLVPLWLDGINAQLLRSPAVFLKLSAPPAAIFLLITFRIRVCAMLPFSLLLACCDHITNFCVIAQAFEAAGLASVSSVMF